MLAQNFKPAAELKLTELQKEALIKTLVLLETEKLKHAYPDRRISEPDGFTGHFNMSWWELPAACGTICCIGGTAELIGDLRPDELDKATYDNPALKNLFYPGRGGPRISVEMQHITPDQAATALRSYLTIGDARWDLAVAS